MGVKEKITNAKPSSSLTDWLTENMTEEEIQKMQDLEQVQLEKAYELGKTEMQTSFEEWLSSFNTESAPQCFNAVQELKKKLEDKK